MSRSRARAEGEGVLGARAQLARVPRRVTLRWSGSAGGVDTLSALAGPASLTLLAPRHPARLKHVAGLRRPLEKLAPSDEVVIVLYLNR